jgi:hypothetical protein
VVHAGRRGTALNLTCNAQPSDLPTTQSRSQVGESCAGQPATVHSSSNPESEESADDRAVPRLWEKLLERPRAGLLQKTLPQNSVGFELEHSCPRSRVIRRKLVTSRSPQQAGCSSPG